MLKTAQDHNITLNIAINLSGVSSPNNGQPITKEDALAVNVAPEDPFLDKDKAIKKIAPSLGPIVDGQYFANTKDGVYAAKKALEKKRMHDYYSHSDVILARKMLKGD